MYLRGDGVPKDMSEAVKWFQKAANQGNQNAQLLLGLSHAGGLGVLKDEIEGLAWLNISAVSGDEEAISRLLKKSSFGIRDRPRKKMTLRNRPRIKDLHRVEAQASPDFGRFFRHVDFFSSLLRIAPAWSAVSGRRLR